MGDRRYQPQLEPAGRTRTGSPLRWQRQLAFRLFATAYSFWYWLNQLDGVCWDCESCGGQGIAVLRVKQSSIAASGTAFCWFACTRCRATRDLAVARTLALLAELGVEPIRSLAHHAARVQKRLDRLQR